MTKVNVLVVGLYLVHLTIFVNIYVFYSFSCRVVVVSVKNAASVLPVSLDCYNFKTSYIGNPVVRLTYFTGDSAMPEVIIKCLSWSKAALLYQL